MTTLLGALGRSSESQGVTSQLSLSLWGAEEEREGVQGHDGLLGLFVTEA